MKFIQNLKNCKEQNVQLRTYRNPSPIKILNGKKYSKAKKPPLRQDRMNSDKR